MLLSDNLDEWMKIMSAEPHEVGTICGRKNAEWMVKQFKLWGYDAKMLDRKDALPLLATLEGQVASPSWRGMLPITYYIEPGPARVQLKLTFCSGLPRRSWYRHQIYAPGFYMGYGVKTSPGVLEAIEKENWEERQSKVTVLVTRLQNCDAYLQSILFLN